MSTHTRRFFLGGALATGATYALARSAHAAPNRKPIYEQIQRRHDQTVALIQEWIRQPSIAAENRGVSEGCELTMRMLRDAGFQRVERMPTDGQPGILATLDAGARRSLGVYFMYDVKQADPNEWMSPPWEARLLDLPDLGTVIMGRGATNQKGPQAAFLAALHAIRDAGGKPPVNLVLVAEGEEEIGSPHFRQIVHSAAVREALAKCEGVFMPESGQSTDGTVTVSLGAKGIVEMELISSGGKWGRGPDKDVHSSNRARLDSPSWHLVQALNTMIGPNGDPSIDNYLDKAKPLSAAEEKMLDLAAARMDEAKAKAGLGAKRWARDSDWRQALEDLCARPTINIEGLVGGYTGPGGMTILPHRAAAKLDLRLVPDMTFDDAVAKVKAHLEKRGFGDIEVNASGGYDPTTTKADSRLIQAQLRVYRDSGLDPILWPRRGGSWPGYVFTGAPINLPAGHFGLGHGLRAHAPDEYYLIESKNPVLLGLDGAVRSYVDYLYALA
jgi:acetylornithine deacetylase/succinyl-diaminopimelate desuccinylase-like protein